VTTPSTVIGGIYEHSATRRSYRVLTLAVSSTNGTLDGKILVVYVSLTNGTIYAREEAEFHEHVPLPKADESAPCLCDARGQDSCSKHPDQTLHPRFRLDRRGKP
jgi:hypothetical protein